MLYLGESCEVSLREAVACPVMSLRSSHFRTNTRTQWPVNGVLTFRRSVGIWYKFHGAKRGKNVAASSAACGEYNELFTNGYYGSVVVSFRRTRRSP